MAITTKWAVLAAIGLILSACAPSTGLPVLGSRTPLSFQTLGFIRLSKGNTCDFTGGDEASLASAIGRLPKPVVIANFDFVNGTFDYATTYTVTGDTQPVVWSTGSAQPATWSTIPAGVITAYDAESGELSADLTDDATLALINDMDGAPLSTILDIIAVD